MQRTGTVTIPPFLQNNFSMEMCPLNNFKTIQDTLGETWHRYKALSDDVQRTLVITLRIFSGELCPFVNLNMEMMFAQ